MNNLSVSQNFIKDEKLVEKILDLINISKDSNILEIGPGKGIITNELIKRYNNVISIEYDKELYNNLLKCIDKKYLLYGDFLEYEFNKNTTIISNIPFNITSNIFNKILDNYKYINDFYFIMQKEAAYMYLGKEYECMKSLLFKPLYEGNIIYEFNNTDFDPVPNVDIVFVHFHKKEYCDIKKVPIEEYFNFLANIFSNNGTNIKDNVKEILTYEQLKHIKKLLKCNINDRLSNICYQDYITLFNTYRDYTPQIKKDKIKNSYIKLKEKQNKLDKINRTR